MEKINLQKYIASCGVCSRRAAEDLINAGRIMLNGKRASVTDRVSSGDVVLHDNKQIHPSKAQRTLILNKPEGYVCTSATFAKEKNIFTLLPHKERLFCVGRLDKDSSGLLVLTTDGDLAQQLTHPKYEHEKEYRIVTKNEINKDQLHQLQKGVDLGDGDGIGIAKNIVQLDAHTLTMVLTEGKKRQIRRMLAAVHLGIQKLTRVRIGQLKLGSLSAGAWRELSEKDIELLSIQSHTAE